MIWSRILRLVSLSYDVEGKQLRTLNMGWLMAGRHHHNRSKSIYWDGGHRDGENYGR